MRRVIPTPLSFLLDALLGPSWDLTCQGLAWQEGLEPDLEKQDGQGRADREDEERVDADGVQGRARGGRRQRCDRGGRGAWSRPGRPGDDSDHRVAGGRGPHAGGNRRRDGGGRGRPRVSRGRGHREASVDGPPHLHRREEAEKELEGRGATRGPREDAAVARGVSPQPPAGTQHSWARPSETEGRVSRTLLRARLQHGRLSTGLRPGKEERGQAPPDSRGGRQSGDRPSEGPRSRYPTRPPGAPRRPSRPVFRSHVGLQALLGDSTTSLPALRRRTLSPGRLLPNSLHRSPLGPFSPFFHGLLTELDPFTVFGVFNRGI